MRLHLPLLAAFTLTLGAPLASAQTVTNVNWFRGGEADTSPTNGATVTTAVDSGTAVANFTVIAGTPTYNSTSVAPAAHLRFGASTFSYNFDGSSYFINNSPTTLTTNFGMEAWINPASASGTQPIFLNGSGGDGYGLYIIGGNYQMLFGGVSIQDTGIAATPGTWTEFAFINQFGFNTLYINGVSVGSTFPGTMHTPTSNMFLGADSTVTHFTGQIDEARIFTWSPGFSVTDLNYTATPIPEPSTYGLVGALAALGLAAWKKRRAIVATKA